MKKFSQKGQGLVEYALIACFVGAIALIVMIKGGFGSSVTNVISGASERLDEAGEISFDYEDQTDDSATYKTLNWQAIYFSAQGMYGTIMNSDTVDKALKSEVNLFGDLSAMVDGHLTSTNAADGTKDWESFLSMMAKAQKQNNFQSSYKRGEETIAIQRLGNSNAVQIRYSDGKEVIYYRLSPDANNVMQIETNSKTSYSQFFSTLVNRGGWEYNN